MVLPPFGVSILNTSNGKARNRALFSVLQTTLDGCIQLESLHQPIPAAISFAIEIRERSGQHQANPRCPFCTWCLCLLRIIPSTKCRRGGLGIKPFFGVSLLNICARHLVYPKLHLTMHCYESFYMVPIEIMQVKQAGGCNIYSYNKLSTRCKEQSTSLPALNDAQLKKLKHLSIVTMSENSRVRTCSPMRVEIRETDALYRPYHTAFYKNILIYQMFAS